MPKYRVERKCYFQNRIFDPEKESEVNMDLEPQNVPRHFTCLDKPKKQPKKQAVGETGTGTYSGEMSESEKAE